MSSDTSNDSSVPNEAFDPANNCSHQVQFPEYEAVPTDPLLTWGDIEIDGSVFVERINYAYTEIISWRRNLFKIPYGKVGKSFVVELARLFNLYANKSMFEGCALKLAMIFPALMLQRPHPSSKNKEHISYLECSLVLWAEGDIDGLLVESRIQSRLRKPSLCSAGRNADRRAINFAKLMMCGKVKSVIFYRISGSLVRSVALKSEGAAGPSGADAADWRRFCSSFHGASAALCESIAALARCLCTSFLDPSALSAFLACCLIALDKSPGIRPIGIGEVCRRII